MKHKQYNRTVLIEYPNARSMTASYFIIASKFEATGLTPVCDANFTRFVIFVEHASADRQKRIETSELLGGKICCQAPTMDELVDKIDIKVREGDHTATYIRPLLS